MPQRFLKPPKESGLNPTGLPANTQLGLTAEQPVPSASQTMSSFASLTDSHLDQTLTEYPHHLQSVESSNQPDYTDHHPIPQLHPSPLFDASQPWSGSFYTYQFPADLPIQLPPISVLSGPLAASDSIVYNHLAMHPPQWSQEVAIQQSCPSIFLDEATSSHGSSHNTTVTATGTQLSPYVQLQLMSALVPLQPGEAVLGAFYMSVIQVHTFNN